MTFSNFKFKSENQKFHSDLLSKKSMAGDMVKEYSRWLSRFLGGDGDEVKMKLDALTERMNALSQLVHEVILQ